MKNAIKITTLTLALALAGPAPSLFARDSHNGRGDGPRKEQRHNGRPGGNGGTHNGQRPGGNGGTHNGQRPGGNGGTHNGQRPGGNGGNHNGQRPGGPGGNHNGQRPGGNSHVDRRPGHPPTPLKPGRPGGGVHHNPRPHFRPAPAPRPHPYYSGYRPRPSFGINVSIGGVNLFYSNGLYYNCISPGRFVVSLPPIGLIVNNLYNPVCRFVGDGYYYVSEGVVYRPVYTGRGTSYEVIDYLYGPIGGFP